MHWVGRCISQDYVVTCIARPNSIKAHVKIVAKLHQRRGEVLTAQDIFHDHRAVPGGAVQDAAGVFIKLDQITQAINGVGQYFILKRLADPAEIKGDIIPGSEPYST